ncbi:MAG: glycosyltransferase [Rubrivivax sp.]|nr:glycosyltransferase [Rubrivivax sp.]
MHAQPFLTIVVPTHQRAHLLRRTLQSIKSQSFTDVQVIVVSDVDDLPTMEACHALLGPADTFVKRAGARGPSASRNLALQLATGRYVMFIDDDDAYQPEAFVQIHDWLSSHAAEIVFFNCTVVNERRTAGDPVFLSQAPLDLAARYTDDIFVKNSIHMSCIAFPRHLLSGVEFDPHMRAYEDWDFMLAAMKGARVAHVPIAATLVHEVHDETSDRRGASTAAKDFNAVVDYLYVYRRHPAPNPAIQEKRRQLLLSCKLEVPAYCL